MWLAESIRWYFGLIEFDFKKSCSHLASHRFLAQRPQVYNLAHSRRLCMDKRAL